MQQMENVVYLFIYYIWQGYEQYAAMGFEVLEKVLLQMFHTYIKSNSNLST